ncbi:aldo/keto reductase [Phenylobacterium sp.]|uniref:aldo/keto reductase n=1 Tax=Phenylobacterium sp. TaxID=1871053 RepID=UPI002729337D|nr:aldo/keto reductase [Phenylobacterium sp.]MDO8378503.1 aldo/keto reductase [Phenylobacterium sp.]
MQTVRLGRTNAVVSAAGLGCGGHSRLGMSGGASAQEASRVVSAAIDLGITFIDTARLYGTEEAVGLGVKGRRDQVFISTKATPTGGRPGREGELATPEDLTESLEGSLRRLGTDHVDLFNLHGVMSAQYDACVETLLPELKRQQAAGKVRHIGITEAFGVDTRHQMLARAVPDAHFDVAMVGFNLLNPSARRTVFPAAQAKDIGTLIMFAVRRALSHPDVLRDTVAKLLASGEVPPGAVDPADPLKFLREHPGIASELEAAYRFCRHEPGAHVILTGTGSVEHLEANIAAINAPPLPAEISAQLEATFGAVDSVSGN